MSSKSYFLAGVVLLLFSACSTLEIDINSDVTNHNSRVAYMKRMLNDLQSVTYSRHKSEIERDDDRRRYSINFANTLKTVSSIVAKFPQNDTTLIVKKNKLKYYSELSKKLYIQGERIQKIADSYDFYALNKAIEDVRTTCINCHNIIGLGSDPLRDRE